MRMPTRLTWMTPPPAMGAERVSAQTMPYRSPGVASRGTTMVTLAVRSPPARTWAEPGLTDVHVDTSLGVCPEAPRNAPLEMKAAAAYKAMETGEDVVLDTWI